MYLSVHTGLSRTFISDVELGRKEPCLCSLEILALSFDLSLGELMQGV
jgi:transcriptional regulator with XRE-family HTH domain